MISYVFLFRCVFILSALCIISFCENLDGHLGFYCVVPHDKWSGFEFALDLDHIDGNHYNNDPANVRTYCKLCHGKKSIQNGDCSNNKSSARNFNNI